MTPKIRVVWILALMFFSGATCRAAPRVAVRGMVCTVAFVGVSLGVFANHKRFDDETHTQRAMAQPGAAGAEKAFRRPVADLTDTDRRKLARYAVYSAALRDPASPYPEGHLKELFHALRVYAHQFPEIKNLAGRLEVPLTDEKLFRNFYGSEDRNFLERTFGVGSRDLDHRDQVVQLVDAVFKIEIENAPRTPFYPFEPIPDALDLWSAFERFGHREAEWERSSVGLSRLSQAKSEDLAKAYRRLYEKISAGPEARQRWEHWNAVVGDRYYETPGNRMVVMLVPEDKKFANEDFETTAGLPLLMTARGKNLRAHFREYCENHPDRTPAELERTYAAKFFGPR